MMKKKILVYMSLTLMSAALDSVVTFNEVNYNPKTSADDEWIEVHNQMAIKVDLSNWRLEGGVDFTFPKGAIIEGGGYLLIAKNLGNAALAGRDVVGSYEGSLSNSGELVSLLSSSGRVMDEIDYRDVGEWPVGPDGMGATLSKIEPSLLSGESVSWRSSYQIGGTPGVANFPANEEVISHPLVEEAGAWRFDDSGVDPGASWAGIGFDDGGWDAGQGVFGTEGAGSGGNLGVFSQLVERFRASDLGLVNGAVVDSWPDTATGDGQVQNATRVGDPTLVVNATPSGESVVRFDGNDQLRTTIVPGIGSTSGFVYFAVVKANSPPGNGGVGNGTGPYLWDRDVSSSGNPLVSLKSDGGRFAFQKRYNDASGFGGPVSTTAISTTHYQIVAIRRNRSAGQFEIWVDGVMEATEVDTGAGLTPQPILIGNHAGGAGGFNGDFAELLIYGDELSEGEFQAVGEYLEARYGLDTAFGGTGVTTSIAENGATSYFRQSFEFSGDANRTTISLNHFVADGAVFYLNGNEIERVNLPAGPVGHATRALGDVSTPVSTGLVTIPAAMLRSGTNVLAVSLHPAAGNTTASFSATMEGRESPPDFAGATGLILNEISPAGSGDFFVEVINPTGSPIDAGNYVLEIGGSVISLPSVLLGPGEVLAVDRLALGGTFGEGTKVLLVAGGGTIFADARIVGGRLQGLSPEFPGEWLFPSAATPGEENVFVFERDVVINELGYNPPIINSDPGIPPTIVTSDLVLSGASWRFNEKGDDLPSGWASQEHPEGGNWNVGATPLANDSGLGIFTLTRPTNNNPRVVTYYFENDFELSTEEAETLTKIFYRHFIDDGGIFYLNGFELGRFAMPAGEVDSRTLATGSVGDAAWSDEMIFEVPPGLVTAGMNRFSVEVHQVTEGSNDVAFDFEARGEFLTDPGTPATPARRDEMQWLELYNRSERLINLSGWEFREGILFTFPNGTTLGPDSYLVITNDPVRLAAQHPGIRILGPFRGNLSRSGERLTLRDRNGNPANSLRYYDGGAWPEAADGDGSSMELIDPFADNSLPAVWAASEELHRTSWQTYRFRARAAASPVGVDTQWREFIFGLHEAGEILLDDLQVIEDPDGSAVAMINNGNFQSGSLTSWRALGNHRDAEIVPDPDGGGEVLRLRATGSAEHMHNHVETTLASGRSVVNGREYEVSFRARWLSGCHLLHTRLYFNRIPHTFKLERPEVFGTPGAPNSTLVENAGPSSWDLSHAPVVPGVGEAVTISAEITDTDGVADVTLHYRVEGGNFTTVPMAQLGGSTRWEGSIPGQSAGNVVQFYLTATDARGASSSIPAAGPESRAMYEVEDGRAAASDNINNIRIVMDPNDVVWMFTPRNLMSNGRIPCTVIDRERKAYYDAGVRIKGSQRARGQASRVGFNLGFPRDQRFRNVHRTVAIDRSEGVMMGQRDLLFDLMATSSGGVPAEFNDLAYVISPNPIHTSPAILQMARFGPEFLDSQFENGGMGTVYEYELVYYPTTTDAGGYKVPQPDQVVGRNINDMGDDPESYRWTYLIKNNQEFDNYEPAMRLGKLFSKPSADFNATVADELDVDQWLRALAYSCAAGAGDTFFSNARHNGQFYGRPDGKILYFPHDMDFAFNATRNIFENNELNRIVANPTYRREYLAHLYEICTTVFNQSWMSQWTTYFDEAIPGPAVFSDDLSYVNSRSNYILSQINTQVPSAPFAITTNGGADFTTSENPVILEGTGWINVDQIRLANGLVLEPVWKTNNRWELSFTLGLGANAITLEAFDSEGNAVGSDSVAITRSGGIDVPNSGNLVISEIFYNQPGQVELEEFIELRNIGESSLDLSGCQFTDGIDFTFPPGTILSPGKFAVVVADAAAFRARYGFGIFIVGEFANGTGLSNGGELITLRTQTGEVVQSFSYDDEAPWPVEADGDGLSLVLRNPETAPDHSLAENWRASSRFGGNPGTSDAFPSFVGDASADEDGDGVTALVEHYLGSSDANGQDTVNLIRTSQAAVEGLVYPVFEVTSAVGADDVRGVAYLSNDLESWSAEEATLIIEARMLHGDGTMTTRWRSRFDFVEEPRQFFRLGVIRD